MNKKQKNAMKYPYLRLSTTNEQVTNFNKLEGISWSKVNIVELGLVGLAFIQIKHISTRRLR